MRKPEGSLALYFDIFPRAAVGDRDHDSNTDRDHITNESPSGANAGQFAKARDDFGSGWNDEPMNARSMPAALVARARIVLAAAAGHNNRAIADRYALTQATVGKWRRRFLKHRIAGLYDELRSGRPRSIEEERVAVSKRASKAGLLNVNPRSLRAGFVTAAAERADVQHNGDVGAQIGS